MKVIVEGEAKEIAALVFAVQERRDAGLDGSEAYTNNLIVENNQVMNVNPIVVSSQDGNISQM